MMRRLTYVFILASAFTAAGGQLAMTAADTAQPYAGYQDRKIKALSQDRVEDLRMGRGAGYALAAELNGYPGPRHVLDLAEALSLTQAQQIAVQKLFDDMQGEARALGASLIEKEHEIERLFAEERAEADALAAAVNAAAMVDGALRATHLRYHIETRRVLTEEQIAAYATLRGYKASGARAGDGRGHGGHAH